jgi:hypothetical protein
VPIPPLDEEGFLPPGLHEGTMDEVEERFARFQRTDQRIRLFEKLARYVREVRSTGMAVELVIDGSFVTAKDEPEDIDLVLVLKPDHNWAAELRPFEYNVVSKERVRKNYRFDLAVVGQDSADYRRSVDFYQQVRYRPGFRKGIVRVHLS